MDELDGMDEIVHEFLVESYENLDQLDQDLVALESDPGSRELLSSIFRTVHTIKGTAGFLGMGTLEEVSHVGEGLLSELRDGRRTMDQAATDVLLALVDTLRAILADIEAGKGDAGVDTAATIAAIRALQDEDAGSPDHRSVVLEPVLAVAEPPSPVTEPGRSEHGRNAAESSIRVDVDLLDSLMRQVGELVLARNQIDQLVAGADDTDLTRSAQRLSLIASELQEGVMKTRMQAIEHLWAKMPRVVRDLASQLGRKVALTMVGGETELDRSLLEAVKDPLTHLVRNAVDHGVEPPAERLAAGKPEQGSVTLRAYHAGGQVVVEITDDGRGIDPRAVAASAVRKGLRTEDQVAALSTGELLELLFLPGFSTAQQVTNVSGRGVGMDVVRTNVQAIGGSVDVDSRPGAGTTWRLRIPLTLAIMPALTVACPAGVFAIAQANLLELVAVDADEIEHVGTSPVYRLRGALLPLVSLGAVLDGVPAAGAAAASGVIAVLQADEQRFGLLVDRVVNNEEIVVKALSPRIKQIGLYSGATVLGDGSVALILDVQALSRRALTEVSAAVRAHAAESVDAAARTEMLLVVEIGEGRQVGLQLAAVTRLERMPAGQVERVGRREVVQYRGDLLPLVRLDHVLGAAGTADPDELLVVIAGGGSAAIVVGRILDVVADDPARRSTLDDPGLLGSTVVGTRVTEILDFDSLLRPYLAAGSGRTVAA